MRVMVYRNPIREFFFKKKTSHSFPMIPFACWKRGQDDFFFSFFFARIQTKNLSQMKKKKTMRKWMRRWSVRNIDLKKTIAWDHATKSHILLPDTGVYEYRGHCIFENAVDHGAILEMTLDGVLVHLVFVSSFETTSCFEASVETSKPFSLLRFDVQCRTQIPKTTWFIEYRLAQ